MPEQLERAGGHHAYWCTDGDAQYNGWVLDEASRDIGAIWTPIGLIRPVRMQWGLMNAGIIAQGAVTRFREEDLSMKTKETSLNYADDLSGFAPHSVTTDGSVCIDWNTLADS